MRPNIMTEFDERRDTGTYQISSGERHYVIDGEEVDRVTWVAHVAEMFRKIKKAEDQHG